MRGEDMDAFWRAYSDMVYKYLYCLTRDAALAEDLTADTFERAFRSAEKFRGECTVPVWLCAIAKRLWYDELRRRRKFAPQPPDAMPLDSGQDIEREMIERQEKNALYRRLHALDEPMREVMYLRLTGDMTFDEIGDILGKSGNWARVEYYRGKERLKREMRNDES